MDVNDKELENRNLEMEIRDQKEENGFKKIMWNLKTNIYGKLEFRKLRIENRK